MNMTETGGGAAGRGEWPGAGATSLTCNPRKFSEKIALHTQRQAEDIAAFREIMMDINFTRFQAQKVRQARSLTSYYGGSLPNVNQMSAGTTETQSPNLHNHDNSHTQQLIRVEHGQRDHRLNTHGRPNRRHTDSAPYLSCRLSPPSGPIWRRSSRFVNERSQMDQPLVSTLSRTRSDSALHTSVRMTNTGDPNSAQIQTAYSRKIGRTPLFQHPVPLIEENVQEEGRPLKVQKMHSTLTGGDTPANNISGSLPDLSSLCLPSAVPENSNHEPACHTSSFSSFSNSTTYLCDSADAPAVVTDSDLPLPSLSSCLMAIASNPSLQSSLSNPNLQTPLSSHSLRSSLSSASLCPSLSSSSLKSSLSSQSLQSCFSSSSLSNQSVQSTASSCSYSSGIGGSCSCSCSSSSLSCSPRACGQVIVPHTALSRRRTPLSPLMAPGEEPLWQLPKQFSPTMSTPLSSITQGVPLDTTKVPQEIKPPAYPYRQLPSTETAMVYQSSQACLLSQSQGSELYRQSTRQKCQQWSSQSVSQPHYTPLENSHHKSHQQLMDLYQYTPQQQTGQQTQNLYRNQQSQSKQALRQNSVQTQHYLQQQTQQYPPQHHTQPVQHQQQYRQCWNPQLQLFNHNQYQTQYESKDNSPNIQPQQSTRHHTVMATQDEDPYWQNPANQQSTPSMPLQRPPVACMHMKELPILQPKKPVHETGRERTAHHSKMIRFQKDHLQLKGKESTSSLDHQFELPSESYTGLNLTPSQTQALSLKLGQLQKLTRTSDSKCQDVERKDVHEDEYLGILQTQNLGDEGPFSFTGISSTVPSAFLDDNLSDLQFSVPELDLESFALTDLLN